MRGSFRLALMCTILFTFCVASSVAGPLTAWVTTASGQFGTVDLTSGAFTLITTLSSVPSGLDMTPAGLIYAYDNTLHLLQIDGATGAVNTIGSGTVGFGTSGGLNTGAYFGIDGNNDLFSIDLATGATTPVTVTGLPTVGAGCGMDNGLAGDSSNLYYSVQQMGAGCDGTGALYRIDPNTGVATFVGDTGVFGITGLGDIDGSLFGFTGGGQIYSLDTTTGAGTFDANTIGGVYGAVGAPEPQTFVMLGSGLAGLAFWAKRKARKG